MVNFKIIFDHSDRTYSPGETINLEIHVQVRSSSLYRSIYTRLQGFAHVAWTESRNVQRNGKSHRKRTTYRSHENLFKFYQTLAGEEGGPDMELSPGSHVYHASFQLPQNLPQNHEGGNGHIRYEAKVHMDVSWLIKSKETASFFLKPHLDLNELPDLREPVRMKVRETFGCFCWESQPLYTFNELPRRGFASGDSVPFTLEMNNDSDVEICGATVKLIEKIVYHAHSPRSKTRDRYRTIWEHHFNDRSGRLVAALQNKVFTTELYFDPSWDLHFFNGCGIITVEYYLKSEARMSGCHSNVANQTRITIGTIPLVNYVAPSAPMFLNAVMPSAPEYLPSEPLGKAITDQPLPTYSDAVFMADEVPHPAATCWGSPDSMESPPPTFADLDLTEKKEQQ